MRIIGRGRYAGETYPDGLPSAGAAAAALRNRNVAAPTALSAPFTPPGGGSIIAAVLFTPRVSGVLQVSTNVLLENGSDADTYATVTLIIPGTNLTVTGGEATSDGWVMGTTTPPVIGGTPASPIFTLESLDAIAGNAFGSLLAFGISTPALPLGVPVAIVLELAETGSGHALAQVDIGNLSVMELP
jgi:hypothetical protein